MSELYRMKVAGVKHTVKIARFKTEEGQDGVVVTINIQGEKHALIGSALHDGRDKDDAWAGAKLAIRRALNSAYADFSYVPAWQINAHCREIRHEIRAARLAAREALLGAKEAWENERAKMREGS